MRRQGFFLRLERCFSSYKIASPEPLRVLDIINLKAIHRAKAVGNSHLKLIQDIIRADCAKKEDPFSIHPTSHSLKFDSAFSSSKYNPVVLSNALCSSSSNRDIKGGFQYHSAAIQCGLVADSYVGSCLVTFYAKCGDICSAKKVFDEIPNRNVVSWTSIISGFAMELDVVECFLLYSKMRQSSTEPNDYTFTCLLSACTGSGALGQGRAAHCHVIVLGFPSYIHVNNALISMYSKCGSLEDAYTLFISINPNTDVVSWNSMIAGYAHHGLANRAIELFKEMKQRNVMADGITFIAVLSSCRHAGLVEEGRKHFDRMVEFGVKPRMDHYSCLVDMFGRAGMIEEAREVIRRMPFPPNAYIWGSLLSSCRIYGNVWVGIEAAESRLCLEPTCAATHVLLLNLYGAVKYWDGVAKMRKMMKDRGLVSSKGYSWIEIKNQVCKFGAEDESVARFHELIVVLNNMLRHFIPTGNLSTVNNLNF